MSSVSENGHFQEQGGLQLGIAGFTYADLFVPARLADLAEAFYAEVAAAEPALHDALRKYIDAQGRGLEKRVASKILTDAAPFLSDFIARMFGITAERAELEKEIL